jgi:xanthine/uracil/vitamin C permease (AzgA family)
LTFRACTHGLQGSSKIVEVLFINFFVDFLDTTGTLFSMASFAGLIDPATGDFEGSTKAFIVDGLSTSFGAVLGTSPVTTYIESAPGTQPYCASAPHLSSYISIPAFTRARPALAP